MFYGRAARNGRRSVASLTAIEGDGNRGRIHAHVLLGNSPVHSISDATAVIKRVLGSILVFGHYDIRRYREERHLGYALKQGFDALFPDGCRQEK